METIKFKTEQNTTKEVREVFVTKGLIDIPFNDAKRRATTKKDGTPIKYGKKGFRHTGDSRYINTTNEGVILYDARKIAKQVAHKAGISNW